MTANRTVIVIPARYASTRFPGKPLAEIAGQPMIRRVWDRCMAVPGIDGVYVATDDERIAACVRGFGGEAIMTSSDLASGTDRMAFVARMIDADLYVNVQGDEPCIPPALIAAAVTPLLLDRAIDIGTAATRLAEESDIASPAVVKVVRSNTGRALYFSRSAVPFRRDDAASVAYLKHVGIYVFRKEALLRFSSLPESALERAERLEQLRALEHDMRVHVELVAYDSLAVDVPEDVQRVEDAIARGTI
jgi:3-deoxy-manno-octulosonate cytidylyltransferase (CMP-KDO synthetase)